MFSDYLPKRTFSRDIGIIFESDDAVFVVVFVGDGNRGGYYAIVEATVCHSAYTFTGESERPSVRVWLNGRDLAPCSVGRVFKSYEDASNYIKARKSPAKAECKS